MAFVEEINPFRIHRLNLGLLGKRWRDHAGRFGSLPSATVTDKSRRARN
jgi:hypothetical protein